MFSPVFLSGNKSLYIFIFVILFCCKAKTQTEYITNGSFEQIDSCYGNTAGIGFDIFEWSGCNGWSNPRMSSTDLWCQNPIIGPVVPPYIPTVGYQNAKTGSNMAGILVGIGPKNSYYGEYIQNKLLSTFKKNYLYSIELYLSKGFSPCTISQIGVKFSNTKYFNSSSYWFNNQLPDAQNNLNNFIIDTLGWQKIHMEYLANGTENYAIIGSFSDSLKLQFLTQNLQICDTTGRIYPVVYFFIDDVSILEMQYVEPKIPNIFSPNNDGVNEAWIVEFEEEVQCIIYNRWGNIIYNQKDKKIIWNGNDNCDGIYYYIINSNQYNYKGFIQLLR